MGALLLLFIPLAILGIVLHYGRAKSLLERWAQENGYQIVHCERRWVRFGPFFFRKSDGQEVYYVTVRDADGNERSGYVRCGNYFVGLLSSEVTVQWDE